MPVEEGKSTFGSLEGFVEVEQIELDIEEFVQEVTIMQPEPDYKGEPELPNMSSDNVEFN